VTDPRDKSNIPPHLLHSLISYAEKGTRTGDCMRAILANDFLEGVGRADQDTVAALPAIASFIYMEMPSHCHGSYEVYEAWTAYKSYRTGLDQDVGVSEDAVLREFSGAVADANHRAYETKRLSQ